MGESAFTISRLLLCSQSFFWLCDFFFLWESLQKKCSKHKTKKKKTFSQALTLVIFYLHGVILDPFPFCKNKTKKNNFISHGEDFLSLPSFSVLLVVSLSLNLGSEI